MARISTYNIDPNVTADDKWIGTDFNSQYTKNFSPQAIADFLNNNSSIAGQSNFLFQTNLTNGRGLGTISFTSGGGDNTSFSTVTTIKISKYSSSSSLIINYLLALVDKDIIISQITDLNSFGIYKLLSLIQDVTEPNFYNATLELKSSNGSLKTEKYYTFTIFSAETQSLSGYATETWVSSNYYPLSSNPAGYVTQQSVLEYPNRISFPLTGISNTIYIALDTGAAYFWNGVDYVVLTSSTSGISGFGIVNRIAKFTPNGSSIGSSKISEQITGDVKINDSGRAYLVGNSVLSIQRAQTQLDFVLGNPSIPQLSNIISDNTFGLTIESKGYLSLKAGATYTEGLIVLTTGKLQVTQTPDNGTTSDKLLVRDSLGNVKQLDYPTIGASVGFEQNFLLMGA